MMILRSTKTILNQIGRNNVLLIKNMRFHNAVRYNFCNMPYYREMAKKLKIELPTMNQQISHIIKPNDRCLVYGVRQIEPEKVLLLQQNSQLKQNSYTQNSQYSKNFQNSDNYYDQQTMMTFVFDKAQSMTLEYDIIQRISENLSLDICLVNIQDNQNEEYAKSKIKIKAVVSLSKFKQYIYREYYTKQLKNQSKRKFIDNNIDQQMGKSYQKYKQRSKSIRIGQDSQPNDIKNKVKQIERWLEQGQKYFKVFAANDSQKSLVALQKFCQIFGKDQEIQTQKIKTDRRGKQFFRYVTSMEFEVQTKINIDFINKRWRRKQNALKLLKAQGGKQYQISMPQLVSESSKVQGQVLRGLRQGGVPYPKQFAIFHDTQGITKNSNSKWFKQISDQAEKVQQNGQDDMQPLTEQQFKHNQRENRRILGIETIQDIIQQMQQLKGRQYEMESFEQHRYKELQTQLKKKLQKSRIKRQGAKN